MAKIAYILPGYEENRQSRKAYDVIADYFKDAGIKPIHVPIKWDLKKPGDFELYNKQFLKKYRKGKGDKVYILGFSFGALIAFLTETETKPDAVLFCSLSPYFKEDYKKIKPAWLRWWKKNFNNEFVFNDLVKGVTTKAHFIAGDREDKSVQLRAQAAKRKLKNCTLNIAKGAAHNINNKAYLNEIKDIIDKL